MNKKVGFTLLLLLLTAPVYTKEKKLIGLMAVRNEQVCIEQCLHALSLFTDGIVVLDDASTDDTVATIKSVTGQYHIEKIIEKDHWYRDEAGDRSKLLEAGRECGGTHFICIDADEMLSANCAHNNFLRTKIFELKPGDRMQLMWIQLWRSPDVYRFDKSVWTNNYKEIIFCDDGVSGYNQNFLHVSPTPYGLQGKTYALKGYEYGLLHFQFVNWRNLLIKQAWYRCLEKIRRPTRSTADINHQYGQSKDETDLHVKPAPQKWFNGYDFLDFSLYQQPEKWREKQVLAWFDQHGKDYFASLDIWDIDWGAGVTQ